jgi:hypothetical protein
MSFAPPSAAPAPATPQFDFRALRDQLPAGEMARVRHLLKSRHQLPNVTARRIGLAVFVGFFGLAALLALGLLALLVVAQLVGGPEPSLFSMLPILLGLVAAIVALIVVAIRRERAGASWKRWTRLFLFAEANGMNYIPWLKDPFMVGSVFLLGKDRFITDLFWSAGVRRVHLGNYRFAESTGISGATRARTLGFLSIGLDRHVPHLVLVAKTGRGTPASPLARRFRANQVDLLEGDFNSYFTLYAPQGYGTDVRYLLTPDLMALLVDEAGDFDVETIDDTLIIYARKQFDFSDPATHERLLRLVATVGAKTVSRTGRYTDDRALGTGRTAPAGRRLVVAFPVFAVIVFVLWMVLRVWNVFH